MPASQQPSGPAEPSGPPGPAAAPAPVAVVRLVALAEAVVLVGYGVLVLVMAGRGDRYSLANAALLAVMLAGWGAGLAVTGIAVHAGKRWGRSPFVVTQVFGLVVGVPVAQGGALVAGGMIAVVAAVGLAAALAPQVTAWVART